MGKFGGLERRGYTNMMTGNSAAWHRWPLLRVFPFRRVEGAPNDGQPLDPQDRVVEQWEEHIEVFLKTFSCTNLGCLDAVVIIWLAFGNAQVLYD